MDTRRATDSSTPPDSPIRQQTPDPVLPPLALALDNMALHDDVDIDLQMAALVDPDAARAQQQGDEVFFSSASGSPVPRGVEESDFDEGANDSDSSLGVPNDRDVHQSEGDDLTSVDGDHDCFVPPIQRLPNEMLIAIFTELSSPGDLLNCMLTSKRWARNAAELLWYRPACTNMTRHKAVCHTVSSKNTTFDYGQFIRRLNLSAIAEKVNDGTVTPLARCTRFERITLTNCKQLTDFGVIKLVDECNMLLALDISGASQITDSAIDHIGEHCSRLQGLNVSGCSKISSASLAGLARKCKYIKRIKLNECANVRDEVVSALANSCLNLLEVDLQLCLGVTNASIRELIAKARFLRELRLTYCELVDDSAFLNLPISRILDPLRIIDLTACVHITDAAVQNIIRLAPRLRNVVLAKCRLITDASIMAIARLGKNLHYLHLGHCSNITDEGVNHLVNSCTRIRYIDLGCCSLLTDASVTRLATLPKLKRIGLVKCGNITNESLIAMARANQRRSGPRRAPGEIEGDTYGCLERVHLSYCQLVTTRGVMRLLASCSRLTHVSVTGVPAFTTGNFSRFCRAPPAEFTAHQREMFCVFSGDSVSRLRKYLLGDPKYREDREALGIPHGPYIRSLRPEEEETAAGAAGEPGDAEEIDVDRQINDAVNHTANTINQLLAPGALGLWLNGPPNFADAAAGIVPQPATAQPLFTHQLPPRPQSAGAAFVSAHHAVQAPDASDDMLVGATTSLHVNNDHVSPPPPPPHVLQMYGATRGEVELRLLTQHQPSTSTATEHQPPASTATEHQPPASVASAAPVGLTNGHAGASTASLAGASPAGPGGAHHDHDGAHHDHEEP